MDSSIAVKFLFFTLLSLFEPNVFSGPGIPPPYQISIYHDSTNRLDIQSIQKHLHTDTTFFATANTHAPFAPQGSYWIYLLPNSPNSSNDYVLAFHKPLSAIEVYPYSLGQASAYGGILVPGQLKALPGCNVLLTNNHKGYLVKIQNRLWSNISPGDIEFIPSHAFQQKQRKYDFIQGFLQGFLWLMLLYNLMLYLGSNQKIHLFYVLYILFNSLYLLYTFSYSDTFLFRNNYYANFYLRTFQLTGVFFYIMFLRHAFLTYCSTYSSSIDRKIFHPFAYMVLLINLLVGSTLFYRIDIFVKLVGLVTMTEGMVAIIGFWYFYKGANWFIRIIMLGSVLMIGGGVTSVSTEMFHMPSNDWYYEIGLVLELILFTYALNKQYIFAIGEKYRIMHSNDLLAKELEAKNRELIFQAIQISAKDEAMATVKSKIKEYKHSNTNKEDGLQFIEAEMSGYTHESLWQEFEIHFTETNPNFYKTLAFRYPNLTTNEVKLCAFLKLNLSTKEIATITQRSSRSIEVMRSRIRQKMNLPREETLSLLLAAME